MKAIDCIKTLHAEQVQQLLNENYPDDVVSNCQFVEVLDDTAMFQCTAEEESTDFFFVYVKFDAASGEFSADY